MSDLQLLLDCASLGDFTGITGNMAKLGLGLISISFDILFMLQHYVFYAGNASLAPESEPLLSDEDSSPQQNSSQHDIFV